MLHRRLKKNVWEHREYEIQNITTYCTNHNSIFIIIITIIILFKLLNIRKSILYVYTNNT